MTNEFDDPVYNEPFDNIIYQGGGVQVTTPPPQIFAGHASLSSVAVGSASVGIASGIATATTITAGNT